MSDKPFVMLCGIPGSGNRLLKQLFKDAGADSYIRHGTGGVMPIKDRLIRYALQPRFVVIPVRHWHASFTSNQWWQNSEQIDQCVRVVIEALADFPSVPVRMLSYECIFLYPEQTKRDLLAWVGLPLDTPWPTEPFDANAKWNCQ